MAIQNITGVTTIFDCNLKRFSSSFGFNSNPTSVELELIPNNSQHFVPNFNNFDFARSTPGGFSGFKLGGFKFCGIIQSWQESWGTNGLSYNVKMVDPRIIFNNIPLLLDGTVLPDNVSYTNVLNVLAYYGSPRLADSNRNGTSFSAIRNYLEDAAIINIYGREFKLVFDEGFADATGLINSKGVTPWHRVDAAQISLGQMLEQVCGELGMDYYTEIDIDQFGPGINNIYVRSIDRTDSSSNSQIVTTISGAISNGTLISYRRGQELRNEPTKTIVGSENESYWWVPQDELEQVWNYWGRSDNGSCLYNSPGYEEGIVLLNHIVGTGSWLLDDPEVRVEHENIEITKVSNSNTYPPLITRTVGTSISTGYYPTTEVLRAALYSQESWETAMIFANPHTSGVARAIGIGTPKFVPFNQFLQSASGIRYGASLFQQGSGNIDRSAGVQALIDSVYTATKNIAENHYGKSFFVNLPYSDLVEVGPYNSTELVPQIEYSVASAAWTENDNLPDGILNHSQLLQTSNGNFKDDQGRLKPFCSFANYNNNYTVTGYFDYPFNTAKLPRDQVFIGNNKLILPINVTQYDKDPSKAIIEFTQPIQAQMGPSGKNDNSAFYNFMREIMGYTDEIIDQYDLLENSESNLKFGLVPVRLINIQSVADMYGIHIPIKSNFRNYGTFASSGTSIGGVRVIKDTSLAPWTYGNKATFLQAGFDTANRGNTNSYVLDSAELQLAGVPAFNIGDDLGKNSQITSISYQIGQEGLTTTYGIKTFILPAVKNPKAVNAKVNNFLTFTPINKEVTDLTEMVGKEPDKAIQSSSNIRQVAQQDNRSSGNFGYIVSKVKPSVSGEIR